MIRVLVVEDSLTARELLAATLKSDPNIEVVGRVSNGQQALDWLENSAPARQPDLITMDIHMPVLNGLDATRRIMETRPVPIVIVSSAWRPAEVALTFQAMEAGALSIIEKPVGPSSPQYAVHERKLLQTVKSMAEVRVVKRRPRFTREPASRQSVGLPHPGAASTLPKATEAPCLVAVGASTGGPPALQLFLKNLPPEFPLPIVIVQHITEGFLDGLAHWLGDTTGFPIHIAQEREELLPGHVYLAPDAVHLGVTANRQVQLRAGELENGSRPSVSFLFRSLNINGIAAIGVLLTGMGRDGASELKSMKERGCVTFAQDKESSVIHGMPGTAIDLGGATHILPPDKIAQQLAIIVNSTENRR